jgi:hypothetical protein
MNRHQKIALLNLCIVAAATIASVIIAGLYVRKYGYGFLEAWWFAISYPIVLVAIWSAITIGISFRKKGRIISDERDLIIDRQAMWIGFGISYVYFIMVCMTVWLAAGVDSLIPAFWLIRIVLGGWIITMIAHSVTTLVCYGRGGKKNE